jgi:hypothetical protein
MHEVAEAVVPDGAIPTTRADQAMIRKGVKHLATTRTQGVFLEDGHAQPTPQVDLKKRRVDFPAVIHRGGREPNTRTGDAVQSNNGTERRVLPVVNKQLLQHGGINHAR